jgi:hypothetical protein
MSQNHKIVSAAESLIQEHFELKPRLEQMIWINSDMAREIRLLEANSETFPTGVVMAFYFPPDFASVIRALPETKDEELYEEIEQTLEEKQMSILAIAERKGLEEGRLLVREMIADILEIKFGVAGLGLFDAVEQITGLEALRKIRIGLKQAQSVAEAEALIRAHANF